MPEKPINDPELLDEEQEMFEHFRLVVDPGQAPLRIDKYMTAHLERTSRHRIQCAIKEGLLFYENAKIRKKSELQTKVVFLQSESTQKTT